MSRSSALNRTVLLTRDLVANDVADETILDAFQNCVVRFVADEEQLQTSAGQSGLVALASLVARMGVQVELEMPNVAICGWQPPLTGIELISALIELGADLIPGTAITTHVNRPDLVFVFGQRRARDFGVPTWYLNAGDWTGTISEAPPNECAMPVGGSWPVGSLTAAGLASAEVFKHVVRRLPLADSYFRRYLAPATLAHWDFGESIPAPNSLDLESLAVVSAGAITQAALFTLFRLPNVDADAYILDDDLTEISNLNRNLLSRHHDVGRLKARVVSGSAPARFKLDAIPHRFSVATPRIEARRVIVGVDDIPSRWAVQAANPEWLGVAGTSHFAVSSSSHVAGQPCSGCLHPRDEPGNGPVPTVSFVSFWAGLSLAARLLRTILRCSYPAAQQHLWLWPLRMDGDQMPWSPVAARKDCPVRCRASSSVSSAA